MYCSIVLLQDATFTCSADFKVCKRKNRLYNKAKRTRNPENWQEFCNITRIMHTHLHCARLFCQLMIQKLYPWPCLRLGKFCIIMLTLVLGITGKKLTPHLEILSKKDPCSQDIHRPASICSEAPRARDLLKRQREMPFRLSFGALFATEERCICKQHGLFSSHDRHKTLKLLVYI